MKHEITITGKRKYHESWIWKLLALPYHYTYQEQMFFHLQFVRPEKRGELKSLIESKVSEVGHDGTEAITNGFNKM